MSAWLKWAVALAFTGVAGVGTQFQLEKVPPPEVDVNMLFVPPKELTLNGATGFQNMIADGLWLGLLQYYGDRLGVDQGKKTVNLPAMFDLITDLDPQFWFAYWLGAWAIGDGGDPDSAVTLLKKGAKLNPTDYNYPFLLGFVYFLFKHDYPSAAVHFTQASTLPNCPRFAQTMAARMYQHEGQDVLALRIWEDLYQKASDKTTRTIAKNNVERIKAELAGKAPRAHKIKTKKP